MSAQPTPGRLYVLSRYPDMFHAETPGGRGLRVGETSSCRTKSEDYANARRLVACWNACDGISTENVEDSLPVKELAIRYSKALCERDDLLKALHQVLEAQKETLSDGKALREIVRITCAAIKKAEGAA